MRCLGRLITLIVVLLLLAAAWLYRDELLRWGRGIVDPISVQRRMGTPSPASLASAIAKVDSLERNRPDSVLLNADEMASLVTAGASFLGDATIDSVTVELGDRTVRVRGMVDAGRLPQRWRDVIPINLSGLQEVIAAGTITPARPGVAEWDLERVMVRGIPVPSDLIARAVGSATGHTTDGRLEIALPRRITSFRVRPEGVALYPSSAAP